MVKLFNILLNGNTISCDYTPENSKQAGHVSMNINTKELTDISYSKYEYGKKLAEIINMAELPNEAVAIWY